MLATEHNFVTDGDYNGHDVLVSPNGGEFNGQSVTMDPNGAKDNNGPDLFVEEVSRGEYSFVLDNAVKLNPEPCVHNDDQSARMVDKVGEGAIANQKGEMVVNVVMEEEEELITEGEELITEGEEVINEVVEEEVIENDNSVLLLDDYRYVPTYRNVIYL